MEVKAGYRDPGKVSFSLEQRSPFNRGNRYKDYVNIFLRPNFVTPEWRCPLDKSVPKEEVPLYFLCPFYPQSLGRLHLLEGCVPAFPLEYQKIFSVKTLAQILYMYICYVYTCVDSQVIFYRRHLINFKVHSQASLVCCSCVYETGEHAVFSYHQNYHAMVKKRFSRVIIIEFMSTWQILGNTGEV